MQKFQRIARRDKDFLNEWCKETENNKMGNTRDLLKKIGEIPREMFMGSSAQLKERNIKDLIEAEEIKKR